MAVDIDIGRSLGRVGCLGLGWIGRHRMEAVIESGQAQISGLVDPCTEAVKGALERVKNADCFSSLNELLAQAHTLDGVMIASPSAMHAEQSLACIEAGLAVFCQKPLGRNLAETQAVVEAARRQNKLLGVDLSYRQVRAVQAVVELIQSGELGQIYAAELIFHNAYGPDKPWFYDRAQSGGGCVIDLGIHLVDLALWALERPTIKGVHSQLYHQGRRLGADPDEVEDFAAVTLELEDGATVRLMCSWNLPAGQDAVIQASFVGTAGGARLRNVGGSFYDFVAERHRGTHRESLVEPPDQWGGRAAVEWARRLSAGQGFDEQIEEVCEVAAVIDAIYGRA